jgi:hypothetical protein
VWTIDHRAGMELAVELGVAAVITNRIHELLDVLGRRGARAAC